MRKHLPRLHEVPAPSPAPPPQHAAGGQEPYSSCPAPHSAPHEQGAHARKVTRVVTDSPHPATQPSPGRQAPHPAGSSAAAAASAPSCAASPEPRAPSPVPLPRQRPNRACARAPPPAVAAAISRPRRLRGRQMVVPCQGSLTARAVPCLQHAGSRALVSSFLCSPSSRLSTCISAELAAVTARCHHSSNSHLGARQYTKLGLLFPRWTDLYLSLLILPVTMCCVWARYLKAFLPFLQSPHGAPPSTTSWKGWPRASPVRCGNQGVSLKA